MTLSIVISIFKYVMTNPIVEKDGLLEFTAHSRRLIICYLHDEFHFSLTTQIPEYYVTFNIDLCLDYYESDSVSAPDKQDPPSYHSPSNDHLVPPGVPFKLPCPCCACPLK